MGFSKSLVLFALTLFFVSCKQSSFHTKKYLNLKKLEPLEETSETPNTKKLNKTELATFDKVSQVSEIPEGKVDIETSDPNSTVSSENKALKKESTNKKTKSAFHLRETPRKLNHIVKPKPLLLDNDVDPEVKKLENNILFSLIGATVFTIAALVIGLSFLFLALELWFIIPLVALIHLGMTCGILAHVNAMKLRKKSSGIRRNIWVILGIVAGWVWFGIAGIYGPQPLIPYLIIYFS